MQPTDLAWACLLIFSRQLNPNTAIRLALRRNNLITISGFVLVQEILDFSRGQCLNTHHTHTHTHTHTHKYTHTHTTYTKFLIPVLELQAALAKDMEEL